MARIERDLAEPANKNRQSAQERVDISRLEHALPRRIARGGDHRFRR
jgi:hypothetical protein